MISGIENTLKNLVRIGRVSGVDMSRRKARVTFQGRDQMVSGWLSVLQHSGAEVHVIPDGSHTHTVTDGTASLEPDHNHQGTTVTTWMPNINDTVLVLYVPVRNGDGFVLGAI